MQENQALQLRVLPSKHGLPSFDPDCLAVMCYCKFGNADVSLVPASANLLGLKFDYMPQLILGKDSWTDVEQILDQLRQMNYGIDYHLDKKQVADVVAFLQLMNTKLRPAVLHTYWLEGSNLEYGVRGSYANAAPFPGNMLYVRSLSKRAYHSVYTAQGGDLEYACRHDNIDRKIYREAVECITHLSHKLGSKPFLFGNTPTTADAVMIGYLAPLLRIGFPQNRLRGHLDTHQNLCNTVDFVLRRYFPSPHGTIEEGLSSGHDDVDEEFPHKARNTFIFTVYCLTLIVTYALLRGVISVHISDADPVD